ncbi:hypothetical protein Meth11DRAFT_1266 [Methylophilaceae bacterium 11]|uniref:hypothetical protein n=1 Tax=Methylotenera sp. N17 TaxID=1502761 RepID=UPI0004475518|nr:hypothetical protein [Methylotenera sp. N17]EUJ10447.1 hypothetical protein Meth11DRAFT_1266 [Methylophilaceae bacterium 11]
MKIKTAKDEYLAKAQDLSDDEIDKLQYRMRGKLYRRAEDQKLTLQEALAIQLEIEDEELKEWREKRAQMLTKSSKKK